MLKTISKVRSKHLKVLVTNCYLCLLNFLNSGRNLFFEFPWEFVFAMVLSQTTVLIFWKMEKKTVLYLKVFWYKVFAH